MKPYLFALAVLILFGVSSCKKEQQQPFGSVVGKWRWVKSVGGIGGLTLTPQSTGNNLRDEFYADSTFKRYENDSLIVQSNFSIVHGYNYTPSEKVDVLNIGPSSRSILIRNDSLFMVDLFISDGFGDTFVRIN